MSAPPPSQPLYPLIDIDLSVDGGGYATHGQSDMRHRTGPTVTQNPAFTFQPLPQLHANPTQHQPNINDAFAGNGAGSASRLPRRVQRVWQAMRNYLAPPPRPYEVLEAPMGVRTGFCDRVRRALCALIALTLAGVLILSAMTVFVSVGSGRPANEYMNELGAKLLQRRDQVTVVPQVVLPGSKEVVLNVLNPDKPVQTLGEVAAILHKIRHSVTHRVGSFDATSIARRYVPYRYVSANDLDATALPVNATVDALAAVMRDNPPADGIVCEGLLHFGVERNAVYVHQWDDNDTDSFLYNPVVSERSETTVPPSVAILLQNQCRIAEIISNQVSAEENSTSEPPRAESATLEYTKDTGKKRRRRIYQPLLECIDHVLKLSGLSASKA